MGELPPRRRGVTLKAGASLPVLPRFQQSPGIVRQAEPETAATAQQLPAEHINEPSIPGNTSSRELAVDIDGKEMAIKTEGSLHAGRSQPSQLRSLTVNVRVALDAANMARAQDVIARMGGSFAQLVNAVVRNLKVADEDFDAAGVVAPRERLSDLSSVITCRIDRELYERWAQKCDPFGVMRPGDVARGAVNHAFNRAASRFLQELLK